MERKSIMDKNIFNDFQQNRQYTEELLDGVSSGVSLFMVSDKIQFLHFNQAADEMLGYGKRGLDHATAEDPLGIFHPDDVDQLYSEIIATMRGTHYFNYNCKLLRQDGTYQWIAKSSLHKSKKWEGPANQPTVGWKGWIALPLLAGTFSTPCSSAPG